MPKMRLRSWLLGPRARWRAYSTPPDPLAGFPISKVSEGREERRGKEKEGARWEGREGRGGEWKRREMKVQGMEGKWKGKGERKGEGHTGTSFSSLRALAENKDIV